MFGSHVFTQLSPADFQALIATAVNDGITKGLQQFREEQEKQQRPDKLLSRKEATELLHISLVTLYKGMKSGDIPFRRVGRRVLIPKNELLAKLAERKGGRK